MTQDISMLADKFVLLPLTIHYLFTQREVMFDFSVEKLYSVISWLRRSEILFS